MIEFIETHLKIDGVPIKLPKFWRGILEHITTNLHGRSLKPIVIKKSRQVGCSTIARAISLALALTEEIKIMHLFPRLSMANLSARSLDDFILDATKGTSKKRNGVLKSVIEERIGYGPLCNTLLMKKFDNESYIRTDSAGVNGGRIRGVNTDVIILDEAQCMSAHAVSCIFQSNTLSKFGIPGRGVQITMYTPQINHFTNNWWDLSDAMEWHYICPICSHKFPITLWNMHTVWESGFILKCSECGALMDKRTVDGEWISTKNSDNVYTGFHLHQGLNDQFSKEDIKNAASYIRYYDEASFESEVFGELRPLSACEALKNKHA